ncbi:MAG: metallophosphoesterase [Phenylobacterium sp.]|uniref:purple acid phosphatase family protein n=1 Tax=Phenylobacterium sp. TaxID=1871053 RepID=UPI001A48E62E|nr:tartrate-resistant acid phosphatase type 5 family protein [Phenylobacterium sp.]MBL8554377.1 metallophosphoesterase [Phenylobacterium sp.]
MNDGLHRRSLMAGAAASWIAAGAARAQPAPLTFLALGDWGRGGGRHQREVAEAMASTAAERNGQFVLSAGDNFYPCGVQSVADPHWTASFEEIYAAAALQTPWYAALGNHDYRGKPAAQIAYAKVSPRWRMPARYYALRGAGAVVPDLDIFVLDTTPITGDFGEALMRLSQGRVSAPDAAPQVAWLERELAASEARWKIVVGHHPIRSGGHHGGSPALAAQVEPLLERYGVQAYICGHDHALQHIQVGATHHVCSGAGSSAGHVEAVEGTRFALGLPGFTSFTLDRGGLALRFHTAGGDVVYEAALRQT